MGAVKDVQYAIDKLGVKDDMLVIAGDNVLDFSMTKFIKYAKEKKASCVFRYHEPNVKKLQKAAVMLVDENDKILDFAEKPQEPKSNWACPPFYYYSKEDTALVKKGIESGCGTDAPGSYIAWLCHQTTVYAMEMPGRRYDIGNLQSYEQVKAEYRGIEK